MHPYGEFMQTAQSLGYSHGPGRDQWFEMGWSTKPRYGMALVGNWFENKPENTSTPVKVLKVF